MGVAYEGDSNNAAIPGVKGINTAGPNGIGVFGESQKFEGVHGISHAQAAGVAGYNDNTQGGPGVWGESQKFEGMHGISHSQAAGAAGYNDNAQGGPGVWGESQKFEGVHGISHSQAAGVAGYNDNAQGGPGVWGESQKFEGMHGISHSQAAGVAGYNDSAQGGAGIWGQSQNGPAGYFKGNVVVTGDVQLTGGDCAEDFDVLGLEKVDAGTVMVLTDSGALQPSQTAYDRRVAGVISGAGNCRPGLILGKDCFSQQRRPLALVGKIYCKADAQYGPIDVGDLLTTSPTCGHAMRAIEPLRAFGAVIGKAMARLEAGQALIPILIALQ